MKKTATKATAKAATKSASKPSETSLKRDVQNMRNELADRLLTLRAKHDLSQAALAQLAGVDRKTINRIENGKEQPKTGKRKKSEGRCVCRQCKRNSPESGK